MTAVLERDVREVAQQRAAAERARGSRTEYMRARGEAAEAVFAWLAGEATAPLSGDALSPDADGMARERARASDLAERLGHRGDEATRAGVVAVVLGWLTVPGYPETPFFT